MKVNNEVVGLAPGHKNASLYHFTRYLILADLYVGWNFKQFVHIISILVCNNETSFKPGNVCMELGTCLGFKCPMYVPYSLVKCKLCISVKPNTLHALTWTLSPRRQGCQIVWFQTKDPNLGKNFRASEWKMLIYFMAIWNILWIFGVFFDHSVYFVLIWCIFPVLVSCTKKNLATLHAGKLFQGPLRKQRVYLRKYIHMYILFWWALKKSVDALSGANPTIASYYAANSLHNAFWKKIFYLEKRLILLQRWRWRRMIGS
jgi:hypothetical protein